MKVVGDVIDQGKEVGYGGRREWRGLRARVEEMGCGVLQRDAL